MPLFCDTALAARVERAESGLVARTGDAARGRLGDAECLAIPIGGGIASFTGANSPFNKVAGLGFDGVPGDAEFEAVERAFARRAAPVQVELANLADPAIGGALTARGYRLVNFENVLGLDLAAPPRPVAPPGVEVRTIGEDHFAQWLDVVLDGFAHGDGQGVPSHEEFRREVVAAAERDLVAAGAVCYLALRDGTVAGGASMRMADGIAQLTGAATAPAHRRHGVQTALLAARLADAAAAGCDLAVVTTQPGSRSQHNAQRRGFDLLYTRAILVRDADRLL